MAGGQPLPWDMGSIGMTTTWAPCVLGTSMESTVLCFPGSYGQIERSFLVPGGATMVGVEFNTQFLHPMTGANLLDRVVSDAWRYRIARR